jgi:hypothetical protein
MLPDPVKFSKVRQQSAAEKKALSIVKSERLIAEVDLIQRLKNEGFKSNESKDAVIYLINGYEIQRNGEMLEVLDRWNA